MLRNVVVSKVYDETLTLDVRAVRRVPTEVSSSVIQVNFRDLEADVGGGRTMCETIVFSSRSYGSTKINFVLTINSEGTEKAIYRYFYKDGYSEWSRIYADANSIGRYQAGLQRCFKAAVDAGKQYMLAIHPECIVERPTPLVV